MSVWLTIPSARPPAEAERVLTLWRQQGYKIALWCDIQSEVGPKNPDYWICGDYPGYAKAVNELIKRVAFDYAEAEWFVCAGDDTEPDMGHTAEEIAAQCREHFADIQDANEERDYGSPTFGVMQPTGDRYGESPNHPDPRMRSAYIDRVAGSPWIGREFAMRMYGGNGPYWPEYTHMGVDEEIQAVAEKYGVFWQRPDLIHLHRHWARARGQVTDMPAFLAKANSPEEWKRYKKIFAERKAAGFPGSEPK